MNGIVICMSENVFFIVSPSGAQPNETQAGTLAVADPKARLKEYKGKPTFYLPTRSGEEAQALCDAVNAQQ